jgi:2',3'-cyclic-nucleotide 2'-phosphodiesterase (5'-nucleotidase family)
MSFDDFRGLPALVVLPPVTIRLAPGVIATLLMIACPGALPAAPGNSVDAVLSADTEGHIGPCRDCPHRPGLGGLARRATAIADLRQKTPALLLLDAGNALYGAESLDSKGAVIVAAYNALGYDAVNLSYRDFHLGKAATLAVLKDAKFAVVSANLLADKSGEPLFRPYLVKKVGDTRVALIGVTAVPAGLDFLPHFKEQLAGVRIQPPVEALAKWLPRAKAESDRVILLYYGSAAGLHPIREKFAVEIAAILVGGARLEHLPADVKTLVATSQHGRHLALVHSTGTGDAAKVEVTQIAVEPSLKPSAEMEKVLAKFAPPAKP